MNITKKIQLSQVTLSDFKASGVRNFNESKDRQLQIL